MEDGKKVGGCLEEKAMGGFCVWKAHKTFPRRKCDLPLRFSIYNVGYWVEKWKHWHIHTHITTNRTTKKKKQFHPLECLNTENAFSQNFLHTKFFAAVSVCHTKSLCVCVCMYDFAFNAKPLSKHFLLFFLLLHTQSTFGSVGCMEHWTIKIYIEFCICVFVDKKFI